VRHGRSEIDRTSCATWWPRPWSAPTDPGRGSLPRLARARDDGKPSLCWSARRPLDKTSIAIEVARRLEIRA
jgi:hypothetical protein